MATHQAPVVHAAKVLGMTSLLRVTPELKDESQSYRDLVRQIVTGQEITVQFSNSEFVVNVVNLILRGYTLCQLIQSHDCETRQHPDFCRWLVVLLREVSCYRDLSSFVVDFYDYCKD